MKKLIKYISTIFCIITMFCGRQAKANPFKMDFFQHKTAKTDTIPQDNNDDESDAKQVSTVLTVADKNAFFEDKAKYTYEVKNPTGNVQTGTVSYQVFSEKGKKLNNKVIQVTIPAKGAGKYDFEIPEDKPGFYKVNFMVNVSDYDDTTRRAFGIRPDAIKSSYPMPDDFEQFWNETKRALSRVKPQFKVTYLPDSTKDNRRVYLFEMHSLDNMIVRGYLTEPIVKNKNKKFAVLLGLPGYQVSLPPMFGTDPDLAIITLNVRGQGNSKDVINTMRDEYIFYHIENKYKYVMRGAIMDCMRAVDFIFSRPELNHNSIMASGGSMGGFLSIAVSALDPRITLCSAQNPIMSDVNNLPGEVNWPLNDMNRYVLTKPGLTMEKIFSNLNYFDTKNFASLLKCPTLLGIGLLDPIVPPNNAYVDYNNMTTKKHIIIFRDLGHEVGVPYKAYEGRWMRDTFALF